MRNIIIIFCLLISVFISAQSPSITSPDKNLVVNVMVEDGIPAYTVTYKGKMMIENSPLGLTTNEGDFSSGMSLAESSPGEVSKEYVQDKIKQSYIKYKANTLKCTFLNPGGKQISVFFQVSNNNIAFRYELPVWGERLSCVVKQESTGFRFPSFAKSFLSPMMKPMGGFARTTPSYESGYEMAVSLESNTSRYGYVFPGLFQIGDQGWVLLSETGVRSLYCASSLSSYKNGLYTIEYPHPEQNNGFGSSGAQIGLPGVTPWRTITVGETLKPIVETTISWDVVDPLYKPSQPYRYGRGTWSWIIWQDNSMNYEDQVKYIDLAAVMNFEYILIDAWWDARIGYERMEELIRYARSKNVDVFLWYNTNGATSDAFQTPLNKMNTSIARKEEMKWLKKVGVKGIKVDFFGGDKQETMRLYEDILSDANDYGLMVVFHGTTLPRGWERMFPNFVGSEAVVASEMLVFVQDVREKEALNATLHPFIRNSVASMEFGGVILNKYLNKSNERRLKRLTTDIFQLATGILFQSPMQFFALTPNNLTDVPEFEIDFMRNIPTTWDETLYVDGLPGVYSIIARRHGDTWYIAGVNAEKQEKKLNLSIPMLAGKNIAMYNDKKDGTPYLEKIKIPDNGQFSITMQPNGGFVLKN